MARRCHRCSGNLYLEAHREPTRPVTFTARCLLCGRQPAPDAYFPMGFLIGLGVPVQTLKRCARGYVVFLWERSEPQRSAAEAR